MQCLEPRTYATQWQRLRRGGAFTSGRHVTCRGQRDIGQPGQDLGGDGFGWLVGVHSYQDAPFLVGGDERARGPGEQLEPVPDHVRGVVGAPALAGARQEPPRQHRVRRRQVDRRVQRHAKPNPDFRRAGGLGKGPREAVQDVPAPGGRLDNGRGQHVEYDLVRDEIAPFLVGRDLTAARSGAPGFGPEQVTGGDVRYAEPPRQPLALRALAGAGRSEQQQPHRTARSAGMTMSRFWILPVEPLGSASTIHTWRGYLYAATWALTLAARPARVRVVSARFDARLATMLSFCRGSLPAGRQVTFIVRSASQAVDGPA